MHFIFDFLFNCVEYYFVENSPNLAWLTQLDELIKMPATMNEWSVLLNRDFTKLFYFLVGLQMEKQILPGSKHNILVKILLTHHEIYKIFENQRKKVSRSALKWHESVEGEMSFRELIFWFMDKLFFELTNLASVKGLITMKCNVSAHIDVNNAQNTSHQQQKQEEKVQLQHKQQQQIVSSLQLALVLRNFKYFLVLVEANDMKIEDVESLIARISLNDDEKQDFVKIILDFTAKRSYIAGLVPKLLRNRWMQKLTKLHGWYNPRGGMDITDEIIRYKVIHRIDTFEAVIGFICGILIALVTNEQIQSRTMFLRKLVWHQSR